MSVPGLNECNGVDIDARSRMLVEGCWTSILCEGVRLLVDPLFDGKCSTAVCMTLTNDACSLTSDTVLGESIDSVVVGGTSIHGGGHLVVPADGGCVASIVSSAGGEPVMSWWTDFVLGCECVPGLKTDRDALEPVSLLDGCCAVAVRNEDGLIATCASDVVIGKASWIAVDGTGAVGNSVPVLDLCIAGSPCGGL